MTSPANLQRAISVSTVSFAGRFQHISCLNSIVTRTSNDIRDDSYCRVFKGLPTKTAMGSPSDPHGD